MDVGIFARIWATHVMWYEGRPDRARARAEDTIQMSETRHHPFTHTITLAYAAMLGQFRRDVADVDRLTAAVVALATEHGFPDDRAWAEVLRAWSLAAQGAGEEAVDEMRRGIDTLGAIAGLRLPYYRALLAEPAAASAASTRLSMSCPRLSTMAVRAESDGGKGSCTGFVASCCSGPRP